MAYHGNPFSEADDEIIRQGYERRMTLPEIGAKIGRSLHSVGARARALGLRHPNGTRNGNATLGAFARQSYESHDIPTLPYVPGISVTGRYSMRQV